MSPLEILGFLLSVVAVWLTARQRIWCWPVGIASVVVYAIVFVDVKLYSDAALQITYIFLQAYGWFIWVRTGPAHALPRPVSRVSGTSAAVLFATGAAFTGVLGYVMGTRTDAALPWWDAGTTVFSLIAQWLMARKVLECWGLWIAIDVVYVGIYLAKDLQLTAFLYAIFIILACYGWQQWHSDLRNPHPV